MKKHKSVTDVREMVDSDAAALLDEGVEKNMAPGDPHAAAAALFDDRAEVVRGLALSADGDGKTTMPEPRILQPVCSLEQFRFLVEENFERIRSRLETDIGALGRDLNSHRREFTVVRHQFRTMGMQHQNMKKTIHHLEWQASEIHKGNLPPFSTGIAN